MKKQILKIKVFIVFLMMILMGLLALIGYVGIQLVRANLPNNNKETVVLGQNNRVGYIGVELHYDKDPPFASIESPSGKIYDKSETDEESRTVSVGTVTDEKGEWKLTYTQGRNKALSYKMVVAPTDELIMDQEMFKAYLEDNQIVVECEPVYKEPTDEILVKTTYSIRQNDMFYVLDTRDIAANAISIEKFDITPAIQELIDAKEKITINVATQDPNDIQNKTMHSSNHFIMDY
jgi:hypothetical protein